MPDKQETIWDQPPHTAVKHAILRNYLGAWFPKLAWTGHVIFIDGFAGPGVYSKGELGSPIVALNVALEHKADLSACEKKFIFLEPDEKRCANLKQVIDEMAKPTHITVEVREEEFEPVMNAMLDDAERSGTGIEPALVMIDPFGWTGFSYDVIKRFADHCARAEIFVSFMYESINRFVERPHQEENWDRLFGCSDWQEISGVREPAARRQFLINLYKRQLRHAGFTYLYQFELRDRQNKTEYFLVYGSKSLDGLSAMKDAMWRLAPDGSFRFSDYRQGTPQLELFEGEADFAALGQMIVEEFRGQQAVDRTTTIREFVLTNTPFLETHINRALKPLESEEIISVARPVGRTKSYWNQDTTISFSA